MHLALRLFRLTAVLLVMTMLCEHVAFAGPTGNALTARQQIIKRGLGNKVKVRQSNTVLRGTILAIREDSFDLKAGAKPAVTIPYADVRSVDGPGLSKGTKIAIVVGATAVGATAIVIGLAAGGPIFPSGTGVLF